MISTIKDEAYYQQKFGLNGVFGNSPSAKLVAKIESTRSEMLQENTLTSACKASALKAVSVLPRLGAALEGILQFLLALVCTLGLKCSKDEIYTRLADLQSDLLAGSASAFAAARNTRI